MDIIQFNFNSGKKTQNKIFTKIFSKKISNLFLSLQVGLLALILTTVFKFWGNSNLKILLKKNPKEARNPSEAIFSIQLLIWCQNYAEKYSRKDFSKFQRLIYKLIDKEDDLIYLRKDLFTLQTESREKEGYEEVKETSSCKIFFEVICHLFIHFIRR